MKNRTLITLVIALLLLSFPASANQKDSLLNKLSFTASPVEHLSILNQLYEISHRENSFEAEKYLLSAVAISIQSYNYPAQVTCYKRLAEIYERQNDISRSYIFITEARRIAEEQHLSGEMPELTYMAGVLLYKQEKYREAMTSFENASLLAVATRDSLLIGKATLFHTLLLYRSGEERRATILLKKTEADLVKTPNNPLLAFFYFTVQDFYKDIHQYRLALEMNEKAHAQLLTRGDDYNVLLCMKDKAALYTELAEYQKATDVYENILTELNTSQKFVDLQPVILDSLSSFYSRRDNTGFSRYYKKKSQMMTANLAVASRSLTFKQPVDTTTSKASFSLWQKFIVAWLLVMSVVSILFYVRYRKIQAGIQKEKEAIRVNVQQLVEREKKLAHEMSNRLQTQKKELAMRKVNEQVVQEAMETVEKAKEETRILQAEITTNSILLANKNDYLLQLQEKLKTTDATDLKRLAKEIKTNIGDTDYWATYVKNFNQLHSQFLDRLTKKHPDLTTHEIKLVCFVMTGLSTKEIACIFSVEPESIKKARYRLKKKLNLKEDENLNFYLHTM